MIEREYSKALYDLAENVNDIKEEFNTFIILNDDELSSVLNSPKIKKEDKKALLRSVLKGFNEVFIDFLCVLIDNNRFNIIKNINKDFNDLILEENGIVKVMVSTSKKLSDAELNELSDYLCKKLNKKIILNEIIDEELIGGIRILYNGECIDYTFKNIMNKMQSIL